LIHFGHAGHGKVRHPRSRLPEDRFHEDPLRMLRAVRLSSTLGFEIDRSVLSAIKENCKLIEKVSPERIRNELSKILISDRPKIFLS